MEAVMPEQETVDTVLNEDAHTEDGSAPVTDNAEGTIFDNMTPEELKVAVLEKEKSYKELHSKVGQMSGELGELRSFRKEAEGDNKLASVLTSVKDLVAEKDKKPAFDYPAWEKELMDEAQENPAAAMQKFMRANASWSAQDKKELQTQHDKEMGAIREQLMSLGEVVQTTTPDYQENKELIEKLREKGMSIADAKVFAKDIKAEYAPATRQEPPGGINPNRVVAPERKPEAAVTPEEIQAWKDAGETEAFIESMKWKRNRDANLTDDEKGDF
jgi:hypothetical protein